MAATKNMAGKRLAKTLGRVGFTRKDIADWNKQRNLDRLSQKPRAVRRRKAAAKAKRAAAATSASTQRLRAAKDSLSYIKARNAKLKKSGFLNEDHMRDERVWTSVVDRAKKAAKPTGRALRKLKSGSTAALKAANREILKNRKTRGRRTAGRKAGRQGARSG